MPTLFVEQLNSWTNKILNHIRGTNGQSPNQGGGAATPGDTQGEKAVAGLRCPECGVKFESLDDLESHVQTDHPEVSPETSAAGKKAEASPAPKVRQDRERNVFRWVVLVSAQNLSTSLALCFTKVRKMFGYMNRCKNNLQYNTNSWKVESGLHLKY